ncbi:Acg family FMN-binding oxidoreductase [Isoptericola sp. NPDC057191]|uniref:Acg family FMN-binding oxidoreductase n=1 Tax=Isoptericola sp. NPDC057191 TaxID=3346041 RepID=UPI00364072F3
MTTRDERIARIVAAGCRAPSVHNTQPWSVRVEDHGHLTVRADPSRQLDRCDPQGREMFISCGAFLLNLRVGAAHEGLDAHVQLSPDPDDLLLAARVTLDDRGAPSTFDPALFRALTSRRTVRGGAAARPLQSPDVERLRRAVVLEHADVVFLGPHDAARGRLVSAMRRAEALALGDDALLAQDRSWLGVSRDRVDGVPVDAMGGWFRESVVDQHSLDRDVASGARTFETGATSALLTTPQDGPRHWLVVGQALERMLLVATTRGIQASFATRVLENPATRAEVERAFHLDSRAQVLLRFRYGSGAPFTPRREPDDVIRAGSHGSHDQGAAPDRDEDRTGRSS